MPNPTPPPRRLLLVEGPDDKHVVKHIFKRRSLDRAFDISDRGGKDPLLDAIGNEVRVSGRQVVGILMDADNDVQDRWKAISDRLKGANITPPGRLQPSGTIIYTKPRIGIWLMPDNETPGELEEFVAAMIPDSDPVWPRSQEYISSIPVSDRKFSDGKTLRAQVHSWLATREEPRKMGTAIRARDLNVDTIGVAQLVEWLCRLFG